MTKLPFLTQIIREQAEARGASLQLFDPHGYVGEITFGNGQRTKIFSSRLDLNGQAAAAIASDKAHASRILKAAGLSVADEVLVISPDALDRLSTKNQQVAQSIDQSAVLDAFLEAHDFPLIVKPNDGSEGADIVLVDSETALTLALTDLQNRHEKLLVQEHLSGDDVRVVVFGGEVVIAYQRAPLAIIGDGRSTIEQLLSEVISNRVLFIGGSGIKMNDPALQQSLASQGLSFSSVPQKDQVIPALPVANLSKGGSLVDLTNALAADKRQTAIAAADALGLKLAGVDLLCTTPLQVGGETYVLEVNSAPGLHHYARSSTQALTNVQRLYDDILEELERQ